MSDKWIKNRVEELAKPYNTESARQTATIIQNAINEGRPINKIVVGISNHHAVTVNLGNRIRLD